MIKTISKIFLSKCALLIYCTSVALPQSNAYSIHANIIYHITKYIAWPGDLKTGDFIIGIYGNEEAFEELTKATLNKKVGSKHIVIREIDNLKNASDCKILFLTNDESHLIKKLNQIIPDNPVMIITEKQGLALKGACINFIIVNQKLKIEINKNNIEKRKLKIAGELLEMGTVVE